MLMCFCASLADDVVLVVLAVSSYISSVEAVHQDATPEESSHDVEEAPEAEELAPEEGAHTPVCVL